MDGLANVAKQQQTQINPSESHTTTVNDSQRVMEQTKKVDVVKEIQESNTSPKINSKKQVEELVAQLNDAMSPISTNLKFGVDRDDIFYVSVIEQNSNKMIRRFPAEKAASFLPKMQEVTGILFDSKG